MPRRAHYIVQSSYDRRSAARSIVATCASAVFGAALLFPGLRPEFAAPTRAVEATGGPVVTAASSNGECYVEVRLNETRFSKALLDSGATGYLTIGSNQAKAAGIDIRSLSFNHSYESSNGTGHFATTKIATVRIGTALAMRNVVVDVTEGPQDVILVGIEILRMLNLRLRSTTCELSLWS
jgi:clan AA aspartic protease (TIGR02281 family)